MTKFFKDIYQKIIGIDDSPHKIAAGFAIGVFLGVLPGAGSVAAIIVAWIFRVNRAAAFAGSLLTNMWFSILVFAFAVKIGAFLTGSHWQEIYDQAKDMISNFSWEIFRDGSAWTIFKPVLLGFAVVSLIAALVAYGSVFCLVLTYRRRKGRLQTKPS